MENSGLSIGLDQELTARIREHHIREDHLFGALPQNLLDFDEMASLIGAGWIKRDYHDAPVLEAPETTVDWERLRREHRDNILHAISHGPLAGPTVGTTQDILEELVASNWDQHQEELRTLLHSWAYASIWADGESERIGGLESRETLFFYTEKMKNTAVTAMDYATRAPDTDDAFWELAGALLGSR